MTARLTVSEVTERSHRLLKERRDQENLALLEGAVARFPEDPEVRLLYASALVPFRPQDAPAEIEVAVELASEDPWQLKRAASLMYYLSEFTASKTYLTRAAEHAGDDAVLAGEIANLAAKLAVVAGEDAMAGELFELAVSTDPHDEWFVRDLASFLAEHGRVAEALEVIELGLGRVTDSARLEALKRHLSAEESWKPVVRLVMQGKTQGISCPLNNDGILVVEEEGAATKPATLRVSCPSCGAEIFIK